MRTYIMNYNQAGAQNYGSTLKIFKQYPPFSYWFQKPFDLKEFPKVSNPPQSTNRGHGTSGAYMQL
ncbi:hypothetical protein C5167_048499 [Papaver somniferum]|uniref:Uncharacterized protein n=1 Tax=Papaver somniferum TaxID=3469 RepID=A0A4Y7KM48_PAPSO|nr:hypothetical protein C5167_048499 [Papaver somniferum]